MLHKLKICLLVFLFLAIIFYLAKRYLLPKEKVKEVEAVEVKRGRIENIVRAQGKVVFPLIRTIYSKEDGIVILLKPKEGDKVKAGEVLCIICNPSIFEPSQEIEKALLKSDLTFLVNYLCKKYHRIVEPLESSRLAYLSAKERYDNYKVLYSKKAISLQQLKDEELSLSQAEFRYYSAKRELSERLKSSRVITPISGKVIKVFCMKGQEVKAGQELFIVADDKQAQAELMVDEFKIERIKEGQSVKIKPETLPLTFMGKVKAIGVYTQPSGFASKIPVICSIEIPKEKENTLILGSSLWAEIIIESKEDTLLCPKLSLLASSDKKAVWTINSEGRVSLRPVVVGIEADEMIEIIEGLKEGEKVIVAGSLDIKEGELVKIK